MIEHVDVEIRGHVGLLIFANPPHNHATVGLLRTIADALVRLDQEAAVRAVVLASEGPVFCAGADLISSEGFGGASDDPLGEFYDQAIRIFASCKPIVVAIQGAAIGAGLGLALAADFRVAAAEARFSANFVKLGFHPGFGLTYSLPRVIGPQRAARMFLTGGRYKPGEISDWGLVDRLASGAELRNTALDYANDIAENAPLSLLATRATLRRDFVEQITAVIRHEYQEQQKLINTEDHAEGIKSVGQRRRGLFVGR